MSSYGPWKALHTIRSHSGLARFMAGLENDGKIVGYIARQAMIPSPYAYSPVHNVYECGGRNVIIVETKHRNYEVFEVLAGEKIAKTEEELTPPAVAAAIERLRAQEAQ